MNLNEEYLKIISELNDDHYFDNEVYFANVLREPYDIFIYKQFALLVPYQVLPGGYKFGYSRGGIRYNPDTVGSHAIQDAFKAIFGQLKAAKYIYLIIDHIKPTSAYTALLGNRGIWNNKKKGTAVIYPKENWVNKFKSKERYNLTYAGKKGVEVEIYHANEFSRIDFECFKAIHEKSLTKSMGHYFMPSLETLKAVAENMDCYFVFAKYKEKYIAFNVSIFNPSKTRLERVFAGSDKNYASIRAPEYLEIKFIDYLVKQNVNYYDLWMLNEGDGYTSFKQKLADEIIEFAPRSIWYMNKYLGYPYLLLSKLKEKLLN